MAHAILCHQASRDTPHVRSRRVGPRPSLRSDRPGGSGRGRALGRSRPTNPTSKLHQSSVYSNQKIKINRVLSDRAAGSGVRGVVWVTGSARRYLRCSVRYARPATTPPSPTHSIEHVRRVQRVGRLTMRCLSDTADVRVQTGRSRHLRSQGRSRPRTPPRRPRSPPRRRRPHRIPHEHSAD
jgi:hypothetical protein